MPHPGFILPFCSHQIQNVNFFMGASTSFLLKENTVTPNESCQSALKRKTYTKEGTCNKLYTHFFLALIFFFIYTLSDLDKVTSKIFSESQGAVVLTVHLYINILCIREYFFFFILFWLFRDLVISYNVDVIQFMVEIFLYILVHAFLLMFATLSLLSFDSPQCHLHDVKFFLVTFFSLIS